MTTSHPDGAGARAYTLEVLRRIAEPVLRALSANQLKAKMPCEGKPDRAAFTHLEATGRLMAGLAPWLELGPDATEEGQLRARLTGLAVEGVKHAVDPEAPDYLNFEQSGQPLVDGAFLAHSFLRAPRQLWGNLGERAQALAVKALHATRMTKPPRTNWLLFSAMVEAALWELTGECEMTPIETAVNAHLEWYMGDGTYGDGPTFHWDYYNSFVIQPMLLEVVRICAAKGHALGGHYESILKRARRYAAVQEMQISPEGTFPVIGRSSCYRFGAFQLLSQMALEHQLPEGLSPGGVRAALTAVVRRMFEAPGTFDAAGWLQLGAAGHQPSLAEGYISTGSLYLCSVGLLHLGLPTADPFWTEADGAWTQKKIWAGMDVPGDHALWE